MLDAAGPCEGQHQTLAVINAVFNGFQMLMLTFISAYVGMIKKQNGRHAERTRLRSK